MMVDALISAQDNRSEESVAAEITRDGGAMCYGLQMEGLWWLHGEKEIDSLGDGSEARGG